MVGLPEASSSLREEAKGVRGPIFGLSALRKTSTFFLNLKQGVGDANNARSDSWED